MKVLVGIVLILYTCDWANALNVTNCHDNPVKIEKLTELVKVGNCRKIPCRLRRNNKVQVELKLKPESDINELKNSVHAYIVGVPFPFPGYDQTDACPFIYDAEGKEKVGCPLKAGQQYVYKSPIEVLQIYPRVKIVVHWGLTKTDGKDLICFEVPARITN